MVSSTFWWTAIVCETEAARSASFPAYLAAKVYSPRAVRSNGADASPDASACTSRDTTVEPGPSGPVSVNVTSVLPTEPTGEVTRVSAVTTWTESPTNEVCDSCSGDSSVAAF